MYLNRFVDNYISFLELFRDFLELAVNRKFGPYSHRFFPQKNPQDVDNPVDNSVCMFI
jgi:hypothetical protein